MAAGEFMPKKRFRMRKVFTSLLISYVVMLILPCILLVIIYNQALGLAERGCISESLVLLRQVKNGMDEQLDRLDSAVMPLTFDSEIRSVMTMAPVRPGSPLVYQIVSLSRRLNDKLAYISNGDMGYTLFCRDNELIFYNDAVSTGLEFYLDNNMSYTDLSYQQCHDMLFTPKTRTLVPSREVRLKHRTLRAMTYLYPFNKTAESENRGVVHFLIPELFIENMIASSGILEDGAFFILDHNNELLCSLGSVPPEGMAAVEFHSGEGHLEAGRDIFVYDWSPQSDLTFVISLPKAVVMGKALSIKRTMLLSIGIIAVVELCLCLSLARRNATPIRNFVGNLRMLLTDDKKEHLGEYDYLRQSLPRLQSMQLALEEKATLERRYFLDQLFEGRFSSATDVYAAADDIGLRMQATAYQVVVCQTGDRTGDIRNFMESQPADHYVPMLYHTFEYGYLLALYAYAEHPGEDGECAMEALMERRISALREALDCYCTAGIGKAYTDISDVSFSYNQARHCASLNGQESSVRTYGSIPRKEGMFYYPPALENTLINASRHRNAVRIEEAFHELAQENLEKRQLSRPMFRRFVANLEATLLKVCEDVIVEDSDLEDAVNRICKHALPANVLEAIRQEFLIVAGRKEDARSSRHLRFQREATEYIMANFSDPDLSIAAMAERFQLSESYFSQLFKDTVGMSFSACLEKARLDKARALIREDRLEIEAVARQVGYANSTSFRRAFKRAEGMSPSAYRQSGAPKSERI